MPVFNPHTPPTRAKKILIILPISSINYISHQMKKKEKEKHLTGRRFHSLYKPNLKKALKKALSESWKTEVKT